MYRHIQETVDPVARLGNPSIEEVAFLDLQVGIHQQIFLGLLHTFINVQGAKSVQRPTSSRPGE
jgi:hypothetical protein